MNKSDKLTEEKDSTQQGRKLEPNELSGVIGGRGDGKGPTGNCVDKGTARCTTYPLTCGSAYSKNYIVDGNDIANGCGFI